MASVKPFQKRVVVSNFIFRLLGEKEHATAQVALFRRSDAVRTYPYALPFRLLLFRQAIFIEPVCEKDRKRTLT